jgi:hypothetical protein
VTKYSIFKLSAWIATPILTLACAGKPETDVGNGTTGTGTQGGAGNGGSTPGQVTVTQAGYGSIGTTGCKTSCDIGECGPIVDNCGSVVECGDCTAPETCGGSGTPSHCGLPTAGCTPTTCAALGITCGYESDGCGGSLDCWSATAKATAAAKAATTGQTVAPACDVAGQSCVKGTCTADPNVCVPLTCDHYAGDPSLCGPVSDGCGGVLTTCGFACGTGEACIDSKCSKLCTSMTCTQALAKLGVTSTCEEVADGCGGIIASCKTPCSTGNVCVQGACVPDTSPTCTPKTVADCGSTCGTMPDGCNGVVECPTTCPTGQVCGGDPSAPGKCGASSSACQETTCQAAGAECGQIPDGCQGILNCPACPEGMVCGTSNQCVKTTSICVPKTATEICAGICGAQSDGCTGSVACGGCPTGETCGGGGPSICGTKTCKPKTQAEVCSYADACGYQTDGCSDAVNCGTCTWPKTCLGTKGVCTMPNVPGCTNLCPYIDTTCTANGNSPTRLTGKVYAPNATVPLYNALVYVPNGTLPAITTGATCERCEDENLGSPIAAALTTADGSFTLNNVPAGTSFPLVIKMGKWRRVVTIPAVDRCSSVALSSEQTRLPKNMADADANNVKYVSIPHFAVVSGLVDAMECVLRKIGVSDSEFTRPSGSGRIHMYRAPVLFNHNGAVTSGGGGVMGCVNYRTGSTTQCKSSQSVDVVQDPLANLFANNKLGEYDIAVFDCEGAANDHDTYDATLRAWADAGGRVFASHYSYKYLDDNGTFIDSATWGGTADGQDHDVGVIDKSDAVNNPKGVALNTWLGNVGAWSTTYGDGFIDITDPRYYVESLNSGSERFIYTDTSHHGISDAVQQFAFNTPFGSSADDVCGRVLYSAFHVAGASGISDKVFPSYCSTGALTAQEKVLLFMLFDLSACVSVGEPPQPPTCTKSSCASAGATCGSISDGCGGLLTCGTCVAPESCGGGGIANQCGNNCTRTTCGAQGANCGVIADGCGGILDCGTCTSPATCGGGGTPNVCGSPACTPKTCAKAGAQCGYISDGCGSVLECGACVSPAVCGGGGTANVCASGSCTPSDNCGTAKCGYVSDGCGDTVSCGTCPTGYTCVAGVCAGSSCTKRTCTQASANCGYIGDGCGGILDCGTCTAPQVCGGGGVASQCGGSCTPRTCEAASATCGAIGDGCGGIKECGVCPAGQTCGGGGVPNQCGAGSCAARTCTAAGAQCGSIGDGCGDVLECGVCPSGQACVANRCTTVGGCKPLSCTAQGANCGPVADGCGGLLDCGTCAAPQTCGGGGVASQCGGSILM